MTRISVRRSLRIGTVAAFALALSTAAPAAGSTAQGSARVDPPVVPADVSQLFTLIVEPKSGEAVISMVEFYPPPDFRVGSFADAPGWHRDWTIQSATSLLQKATWTREEEPQGEEEREEAAENDAIFEFVARTESSKTYAFEVRATYSDGSVLHWRGAKTVAFPPSAKGAETMPAPTLMAIPVASPAPVASSGGSSTLALVALIVAVLGLVVALVAVVTSRRASSPGDPPDR